MAGEESIEAVLSYWFGDQEDDVDVQKAQNSIWWKGGAADQEIRERFGALVQRACSGELDDWAREPRGRLALVILLDQFTRNIYRDSGQSFAADPKAQQLANEAIETGVDRKLRFIERYFLYMPLMHAENLECQDRCVELFDRLAADTQAAGLDEFQAGESYARNHRSVIAKFGRFPHRNELLGRESTPEEVEHLEKKGRGW